MSFIELPEGAPGIVGPLIRYEKTQAHLNALADALLCGPSPLSRAEREIIAAYVSSLNDCMFCMNLHAAAARSLLGRDGVVMDEVLVHAESADLSEQMHSLLVIAKKVRASGLSVSEDDVARAKAAGADDEAIHDTVLIAAAFCMFNRYVDGLRTPLPEHHTYAEAGSRLAVEGYTASIHHTCDPPTGGHLRDSRRSVA